MSEFERKALNALDSIKIFLFAIFLLLCFNTWLDHSEQLKAMRESNSAKFHELWNSWFPQKKD